MKMDRDINTDGTGKYGLILKRRLLELKGEDRLAAENALIVLESLGVYDDSKVGEPGEFFVMRLKDKFAYRGLMGYAKAIELHEPYDADYAESIHAMAARAGINSPFCKLPD